MRAHIHTRTQPSSNIHKHARLNITLLVYLCHIFVCLSLGLPVCHFAAAAGPSSAPALTSASPAAQYSQQSGRSLQVSLSISELLVGYTRLQTACVPACGGKRRPKVYVCVCACSLSGSYVFAQLDGGAGEEVEEGVKGLA